MQREAQVDVSLNGLTLAHAKADELFFTADEGYLALRIEADEVEWSSINDTRRGGHCRLTQEPAGALTHYRLFVDWDEPTWEARCESLIAFVGEVTEIHGFMLDDDARALVTEAIRAVVARDRDAVARMGADPDTFWMDSGEDLTLPVGEFDDWDVNGFPDNDGLYLHVQLDYDLTLRMTLREDGIELDDLHVM